MLRRATTAAAATLVLLLLAVGCGDGEPKAGRTRTAPTNDVARAGELDSAAYDELLGAISALDDVDEDDLTVPVVDAASANLALDWSEASSPFMFAEFSYDDASEAGSWCITSKQGAYLAMYAEGEAVTYLLGDGPCNYDVTTAEITATDATSHVSDDVYGSAARIQITKGVDLLGEDYQRLAGLERLAEVFEDINIPVDAETETAPAAVPADVHESLPAGYEIRDYEVPGHGEWYSYCLVDTSTGAWATVGTDGIVGFGPSDASCAWDD